MAAVTKGTLSIARKNLAKKGKASGAVLRGDPMVIDGAATYDNRFDANFKKATAETTIHGIAMFDCPAGGLVEVLTEGEVEGYSGLAVATPLSVAAGAIDSTAPSGTNPIQLIALTATRVWVKI
jgi:hypothetical protein